MDELRKVVLIGAAGTIGSRILKALLADGGFDITILTRPESSSTFPENHARISVQRVDYSAPNLVSVFSGHDAVVCAISIQSVSQQKAMIEAAVTAGVPRFVLNEFGNSPIYQRGLPDLDSFRTTKREMLQFAREQAATHSSFTWSGLAVGNILDLSMIKFPAFGFDLKQRKARLVDDGSEVFTASTLDDIGIAVRGILLHPAQTANRYLHIRSTETTQKDILVALRKLDHGEWQVESVESDMLLERGRDKWSKGDRSGVMDLLVVQLFQKGAARSVVVSKEDSDNALLGVRERQVDDIVGEVLKHQQISQEAELQVQT